MDDDETFPIDGVIAAETVGLRIGSPVASDLVYLQFFYTDATTEEEKRYTLRISLSQMEKIAETYPLIRDEVEMFGRWDAEFDNPDD